MLLDIESGQKKFTSMCNALLEICKERGDLPESICALAAVTDILLSTVPRDEYADAFELLMKCHMSTQRQMKVLGKKFYNEAQLTGLIARIRDDLRKNK